MYIIYLFIYIELDDYCRTCTGQENYIAFTVHFRI